MTRPAAVDAPVDRVALDTSAAVALLAESHPAHHLVVPALRGRSPVLTGHSLAETYSVLTRLSGDARVAADDAVRLLADAFGPAVCLSTSLAAEVPQRLAERGVSGGAVYDALVAMAATEAGLVLLTRDGRATTTYRSVGVVFELLVG